MILVILVLLNPVTQQILYNLRQTLCSFWDNIWVIVRNNLVTEKHQNEHDENQCWNWINLSKQACDASSRIAPSYKHYKPTVDFELYLRLLELGFGMVRFV